VPVAWRPNYLWRKSASKSIKMGTNHRGDNALDILFVSHDAHPHGSQYVLLNLTTWLKESGLVNPRFILAGPGSLDEEFLRVGPVLRLDFSRREKAYGARTVRLLRSFCGDKISAVYLNSTASGHVIELTRHLNVPHVAHVHELEKSIQRFAGAEKMAALRDHAHTFIAVSEPVAENLHRRHGIARDKLRIVHAFIKCTGLQDISGDEKRSSRAALGLNPDAKIVLACGTTDWRKGPDLFVQVAAQLRMSYTRPVQFVWVGGATGGEELRELERLVAARGLNNEDVTFVGETATPLPYMIAADVFLLPSREDPFPLVCLEAADVGLPVICFAEAGGMPDFVGTDGGAVVPYLDVPRMADELSSLLNDEAKTRTLGRRARERVRRHFDVSVKGREVFEILAGLCSARDAESFHTAAL